MTRSRFLPSLLLLAFLLSACASGTATTAPQAAEPSATAVVAPTETTVLVVEETATTSVEQPATPTTDALPVATSRGPDLHATDPTTVSLASGGLQLVEFFRFT